MLTLGNIGIAENQEKLSIKQIVQFANSKPSIYNLGLKVNFKKVKDSENLGDLKHITRLNLSTSQGVTSELFEIILKIPGLESISLSETDFPHKELLRLNNYPRVKVLNLEQVNLTDQTFLNVLKLKHIQFLDISKNQQGLSRITIENLRLLPELKEVDARHTAKPGYFKIVSGDFVRVKEKDD